MSEDALRILILEDVPMDAELVEYELERAPSIPFLIVTGSVNEETAVGCMKAGATDYLLKSNLARIGPAIQAALERGRAQAQKIQAEAALASSERRFRSLVQNSSDLVTILAPDG